MRKKTWARILQTRWALLLTGIFVTSFLLRALVAVPLDHPPTTFHDAGWYDFFGKSIAAGNGYSWPGGAPTAAWPPGYPYFLGGVYFLTGDSQLAARIAQAALGGATVVVTTELGRRLANAPTGIGAGLILAMMPSHVLFSALLMSEVLFTFLLVLGILLAQKPTSFRGAAAAGVVFGLAVLVRPQAAFILTAIFIWWISDGRFRAFQGGKTFTLAVTIVAVSVLTILPWSVRNAVRLDTFGVSTNTGINLWIGNNPNSDGGFVTLGSEKFDVAVAGLERPESEVAYDRLAREVAVDYIRQNPLDVLALAPEKIRKTYEDDRAFTAIYNRDRDNLGAISARELNVISDAYYYLVLVAAVCGSALLFLRERRSTALLLVAIVLAWSLVSVVFFGQNRFHMPMLPILAIAAGHAVSELARVLASRRSHSFGVEAS